MTKKTEKRNNLYKHKARLGPRKLWSLNTALTVHNALQFASNQQMCLSVVQQTVEAWRAVFCITASVYVFGTIFYGLFGPGEIQPWASLEIDVLDVHTPPVNGIPSTEQENNTDLAQSACQSLPTDPNARCNSDFCTKL